MINREKRAEETRHLVLDAAIDLFVSEGFEKTSMDAIALSAHVAKGTLYYHYDSKEGILDAILERYARSAEDRLAAVEADGRLDSMAKLASLVRTLKDANSAMFGKLHHVRYIDIHQKTTACMVDRFAPYFARVFEEGNRSRTWRVEYPLECAQILLAAGAVLLDPESGPTAMPRRVSALANMSAAAFGIPASEFERIYRPLAEPSSSRKTRKS